MSEETNINNARYFLEKAALKYARMKVFGEYLEANGVRCKVCWQDQQELTDLYQKELTTEAVSLLSAMTCQELPELK